MQGSSHQHSCSIDVSNFDGTMEMTVWSDPNAKPYAIALDPVHGRMYWTDCGAHPRIGRATMDGTKSETIIDRFKVDIEKPIAITLDFTTNQIFWLDSELHSISSCEFDGSNSGQILKSTEMLSNPYSLSVFENHVYWTNWETDTVMEAYKFNGSGLHTVVELKSVCKFTFF